MNLVDVTVICYFKPEYESLSRIEVNSRPETSTQAPSLDRIYMYKSNRSTRDTSIA